MTDGWIAPKIYRCGYADKNINRWKRGVDNDTDMLECPKCQCRVLAKEYILSVGTKGFSFCPYCGEDLRPDQMTMEEMDENDEDDARTN